MTGSRTREWRVAVVGGGIAGLAAALRLLERSRAEGRPVAVTVLEADPVPGGKVRTDRVDGLVIEQGPDSLVAQKPHGIALARRLGLGGELVGPGPAARRTYVVRDGRLWPMPEGFALGVPVSAAGLWRSPLFSWRGKLRASLEPLIPPRRDGEDESLASFLRRRLGREVAERLAAPLLAGIASGDPEQLSVRATFPQLVRLEREYGSLVRGMRRQRRGAGTTRPGATAGERRAAGAAAGSGVPTAQGGPEPAGRAAAARAGGLPAAAPPPGGGSGGGEGVSPAAGPAPGGPGGSGRPGDGAPGGAPFVTLRGGLGRLPQAAAARIRDLGGRLVTGARVVELAAGPAAGTYTVTLAGGQRETFDAVVLAVPAWAAAELLEPLVPGAAAHLAAIPYKSTAVVALAFPQEAAGPLDGSGFIVPPGEGRFLTACTWVSAKWPGTAPPGIALLRAFAGRPGEDPLELEDAEIAGRVLADLRELAGVRGQPLHTRVYRWPRAMPQYPVGHLDRLAALHAALQEHPRLALAGAGYRGVGVPDCIRQGEEAADRIWAALAAGRHRSPAEEAAAARA